LQARIPEGTKAGGTTAWRKRIPHIRGGVLTTIELLTACGGGETGEEPTATNPAATTPGYAPAGEPAGGEHTR
jgi:hypothetical protein